MMVIACIYLLTECEILLTTYCIYRNGYVSLAFLFCCWLYSILYFKYRFAPICEVTKKKYKKIIKDYNMKDAMPQHKPT